MYICGNCLMPQPNIGECWNVSQAFCQRVTRVLTLTSCCQLTKEERRSRTTGSASQPIKEVAAMLNPLIIVARRETSRQVINTATTTPNQALLSAAKIMPNQLQVRIEKKTMGLDNLAR